jgi:predicted DNA binding CopG/RHH family protein
MKKRRAEQADIVRTTIRVPRRLWEAAKHRAIEERLPLQDLVIKALQNYVKKGGRS